MTAGAFPFAATVAALGRVRFARGYDLGAELAYAGHEVRRVLLARLMVAAGSGTVRPVIAVLDAAREDPRGSRLGVLRPVQRYVLRAGIARAERLYESLRHEGRDDWGYLRTATEDGTRMITVTPPVLEELPAAEADGEAAGEGDALREFILCDGNHRVVNGVWNRSRLMPAVAVLGPAAHPFYARPFSRYGWSRTAGNVQLATPPRELRYAPRDVDLTRLGRAARQILARVPEAERHRRYIRDLSTGFGDLGGQGGLAG